MLLGGLAQVALFVVLLVAVQPPQYVYLSTPVAAGVIGALLSDRFQSEYIDAGGAGLVGSSLSLGAVAVIAWGNTASLPPDLRIDLTLLTVLIGLGVLLFVLPLAVLISTFTGWIAVIAQETRIRS
jgi:hypothetical protein